ncbi:DEHA2E07018p [Debaryomyces hansenii CBS767]|uniref:Trafficking protein particle complex subunit BET3 n=1 Tax=Debaryomyces hansenii (strain ATCC 36239 / CBS 767 / BCRC 21394 / JCM 1990 / NBRC 0083 / IGC 2968) TaxID=284592 RepID=Q6BQA5_DEBHA|nr:DEHA2E07018p [Debaryomyces hansenii CBS767]CAG87845.2 DEHA2E07018p [Debaryomyces hansenii CBS767]|eukprot:XP_459615.2 DEHA2E07018p [Debaryomyces hansenii CBS767]
MSKASRFSSDDIWKNNVEKINSELFTLTYGSVVSQLCRDYNNNYQEVNQQLDRMGYNIGLRLIEEFVAKTGAQRCQTFKETAEIISKVGFKIFLNIQPVVTNWSQDGKSFSLILVDNPLAEFVELPVTNDNKINKELWYSQILCGVLRGALQMVQLDVDVWFVKDALRGDEQTELRLKLNKILKDEVPAGED